MVIGIGAIYGMYWFARGEADDLRRRRIANAQYNVSFWEDAVVSWKTNIKCRKYYNMSTKGAEATLAHAEEKLVEARNILAKEVR